MFAPWSHICGNMIICNGGHVYTLNVEGRIGSIIVGRCVVNVLVGVY